MNKQAHIGKIISDKLKEKGIKVKEFAGLICCERANAYKILKRKSIDTELLCKISAAIDYNFFVEFLDKNNKFNDKNYITLSIVKNKDLFIEIDIQKELLDEMAENSKRITLETTHTSI
jgi:transcriptional regulator with XRE-family HTH domain